MSRGLFFPELAVEEHEAGWLAEYPPVSSAQVFAALGKRHPMDGWNGLPGRWVFVREVQAETGSYGDVQRFDAVAVGLVPSVKYARVVYEIKVSRADWLRELRPIAVLRDKFGDRRLSGKRAASVLANRESLPEYGVSEGRKWDAALAISTEFWIAAPPRCVQLDEVPPEAGLVEVRPFGPKGELRPRVIKAAPVRETPMPSPAFWAAVLRRAAERERRISPDLSISRDPEPSGRDPLT